MKTPHTSTHKGKLVYIRLKSGERIVGRFQEKHGNFVVIDGRRISAGDVKAFAIYRDPGSLARKMIP